MGYIWNKLFNLSDEKYKKFHNKLMPTVPSEKLLGVRTPQLRGLAKEIAGTNGAEKFLSELPHKYYEEDNLHAFLIEQEKNFDTALLLTEAFLPYIDNWATCDSFNPPIFKRNAERLLPLIAKWLKSEHTYTVRYGIKALMIYFLDEKFDEKYLRAVADIKSDEYYIKMMQAWYFATALAKQYDVAVKYLEARLLDEWVHRKTIQKAIESYRISPQNKEYLKKLK